MSTTNLLPPYSRRSAAQEYADLTPPYPWPHSFPNNNMDTDASTSQTPELPQNSYQNLMEGNAEVVVKSKEGHQTNLSELLRDLYKKYYKLQTDFLKATSTTPPVTQ